MQTVRILSDASLLVVDEDTPTVIAFSAAMERNGFSVTVANSVNEAMERVANHPPAHAIIEHHMKDGSGLDVIRSLRAARDDCRVVVLTSFGSIANAVASVKLGAIDYLSKPSSPEEVQAALLREIPVKAAPTPYLMTANRLRWEYIQRIHELCDRNTSATARRLRAVFDHSGSYPHALK